jgi:DNA-binding NarL/FixJ family response regulator
MSLRLAEQLNLVQQYIKVDKTEFNQAMQDAKEVIGSAQKYLSTLRKIRSLTKSIKTLNKLEDLDAILKLLDKYPQIKSLKEAEVLKLMVEAKSNKEIAEHLCVSEKAIKWHKAKIFKNIGLKNTMQTIQDYYVKTQQGLAKGNSND